MNSWGEPPDRNLWLEYTYKVKLLNRFRSLPPKLQVFYSYVCLERVSSYFREWARVNQPEGLSLFDKGVNLTRLWLYTDKISKLKITKAQLYKYETTLSLDINPEYWVKHIFSSLVEIVDGVGELKPYFSLEKALEKTFWVFAYKACDSSESCSSKFIEMKYLKMKDIVSRKKGISFQDEINILTPILSKLEIVQNELSFRDNALKELETRKSSSNVQDLKILLLGQAE